MIMRLIVFRLLRLDASYDIILPNKYATLVSGEKSIEEMVEASQEVRTNVNKIAQDRFARSIR